MNPYSQHGIGEVVLVCFQQKSKHEQLDGNPHLDEQLPYNR